MMMRQIFILCSTVLLSWPALASSGEFNPPRPNAAMLNGYTAYPYPYNNLAKQLEAQGHKSLLLFSYGSLMDTTSAMRTLSEQALATRRPAVAYGLKRTFDFDVESENLDKRWGIPHEPLARGLLNVQTANFSQDYINGVLIDLPLSDIEPLLNREQGYDLVPVVVLGWEDAVQGIPSFSVAYILKIPNGSLLHNGSIFPRPGYYEVTRDAAKQYGPLFSKVWFQTTYMGDGKTPIEYWEALWQQGDNKTKSS